MKTSQFLKELEQQAKLEARLEEKRVLPRQMDWATAFVGNYPWQVLVVLSGLTALGIELFGR